MPVDFDYAYNFCKEIAKRHYENFPVGSLLIPKNKRKYIYSVYAFARTADDIADSEKYSSELKIKKLDKFDNELKKIENKKLESLSTDTKNIFIALYDTVSELKIPVNELRKLLIAFKQDSIKQRYDTFEELIQYSDFSANPIGHLVLYVFGYNPKDHEESFKFSDKICTALQLTNFWQDVSVDLKINRIYIPVKLMKKFNYEETLLQNNIENENFRKIIKELVDSTREIFEEGKKILNFVSGRLKLELKATIAGGMEILNKIEKTNYNVLTNKVKINNMDKLNLIGKTLWR
jgi:squalene synthase HpnC